MLHFQKSGPVRTILLAALFICQMHRSPAQWRVLVEDGFQTDSHYLDLSGLLPWGSYTATGNTAFTRFPKSDRRNVSFQALAPSDSGMKYGGSFTNANSLKTAAAIDYRLPVPLDRNLDSFKVEFDAFWDTLVQIGEGGRVVVALLHSYPESGPQVGWIDSVNKPAPFGRPAYNIRILNRSPNIGTPGGTRPAYLFYGGGMDPLGEFEKTSGWWLPGFIAQPGGTSPQTGPAYPFGPTLRPVDELASQSDWQHFTFIVYPERIEFKRRPSALGDTADQVVAVMPIPKTQNGIPYALSFLNQYYGTNLTQLPFLYRWFPQIDAVRFYFRCVQRAYLANVRISSTQNITAVSARNAGVPEPDVYPNPSPDGRFRIRDPRVRRVEIRDATGRLAETLSADPEGRFHSTAKPGLYLVRFLDENKLTITTKRLIIRSL